MNDNGMNSADICVPESQKDSGWFVLRYRNLSTLLRQQLGETQVEVFHPYRLRKTADGNDRTEVPVLHGYVFVHATLAEVKKLSVHLGLPIMRNPFWEFSPSDDEEDAPLTSAQQKARQEKQEAQKYLHIRHKAMVPFMKAAELKAYDLEFFDPKVIDLEMDDLVEFMHGDMKGVRGYLKAGKGRNGGLVIVPLSAGTSDDDDEASDNPNRASISFSLQAHQNDLAVVAFAKGNRHAKDCVVDAKPVVAKAFETFRTTGTVDKTMREKLISFVRRYGQTRLNTNMQAAQHYALLYRIYTILGHGALAQDMRERIDREIVPELMRRKEAALKRGNATAAQKQQDLLDDVELTGRCTRGLL